MIPWWDMGLRLLIAAWLGGVIGINREHHEWAAGLRTHILVCVGSVLAMIVSAFGFSDCRPCAIPTGVLDSFARQGAAHHVDVAPLTLSSRPMTA